MNKQIALDPFQSVPTTGIAINDLNKLLGSVLEKIKLTLGGTFTRAMITLVQLKLNGKVVYETTGTRLDASAVYNGITSDVTILNIDFMDRRSISANARQAGSYDLSKASGIVSARLEVTIAGATAPTLIGVADVSPPTEDPDEKGIRWLMSRKHSNTQVIGASGTYALQIPHIDPAGGGSNYRRVYIFSANCTAIKSVREGIAEHELFKLQNESNQRDNFKVPQANLILFNPVQDGQLQGRTWDTRPGSGVRSAQFYGTFSAGETITIETDELIPFSAY